MTDTFIDLGPNETLPKLKPGIKKRWLKALRSGKYQQTYGYLRRDDRMCCLGVLCDVVKNDKNLGLTWSRTLGRAFNIDGQTLVLPPSVELHVFGENLVEGSLLPLTERNDGGKGRAQSFNHIADLIERHM